ncbi:MAG: hypothetical protein ACOY6K_19070, partial [Pseudomonadota bacterium]
AHGTTAARGQGPLLPFDDTDDFGTNGAETRNTHSEWRDHDALTCCPERLFLGKDPEAGGRPPMRAYR